MFKIILFTGVILLVTEIVMLSLLTKYKKLNKKIFGILLPLLTLAIFVGCFAANFLITKEVSLLSNWKVVTVSENTTYSDKIDIFLKEENGKKIVEQNDGYFYFYLDENTAFLNSTNTNNYDHVSFEINNETGFVMKKTVKKYDYEFVGDYWFLGKYDTVVIEKIKSQSFITETKPYSVTKTELVFFVPQNTLVKTKNPNGIDVFKTIDELNAVYKIEDCD